MQAEVTRLEERRLHLITLCLKAKMDLGWHDEVITELSRLIAECPLRDELWAQRMLALHRAGTRPSEGVARIASVARCHAGSPSCSADHR